MVLVDTSVWIEFLRGKQPFLDDLGVLLVNRQVLTISCIMGELLQGTRSKREEKVILAFWRDLPKIPVQMYEGGWIGAAVTSVAEHWYARGIGLIDAVIICIAKETKAKLWTLDRNVVRAAGKISVQVL